MFYIEGDTITLSAGDTGTIQVKATGTGVLADRDRVMFTIKDASGGILFQRVVKAENNVATIVFANEDTDEIVPGTYNYDVRFIVNPYYDSYGNIVNGDVVNTPKVRQKIVILPVVGDV